MSSALAFFMSMREKSDEVNNWSLIQGNGELNLFLLVLLSLHPLEETRSLLIVLRVLTGNGPSVHVCVGKL